MVVLDPRMRSRGLYNCSGTDHGHDNWDQELGPLHFSAQSKHAILIVPFFNFNQNFSEHQHSLDYICIQQNKNLLYHT